MSQEVERSSTRPRPLQQSTRHVVLGRDTECCVLTLIAPDERVEPRSCGEMLTCDKGALDKYSPFTIHRVTGLALCRQIDVLILPSDTMHCPWNTVWFSKVLAVNTVNNFIIFGHSLHFKVPLKWLNPFSHSFLVLASSRPVLKRRKTTVSVDCERWGVFILSSTIIQRGETGKMETDNLLSFVLLFSIKRAASRHTTSCLSHTTLNQRIRYLSYVTWCPKANKEVLLSKLNQTVCRMAVSFWESPQNRPLRSLRYEVVFPYNTLSHSCWWILFLDLFYLCAFVSTCVTSSKYPLKPEKTRSELTKRRIWPERSACSVSFGHVLSRKKKRKNAILSWSVLHQSHIWEEIELLLCEGMPSRICTHRALVGVAGV